MLDNDKVPLEMACPQCHTGGSIVPETALKKHATAPKSQQPLNTDTHARCQAFDVCFAVTSLKIVTAHSFDFQ